MVTTVLQPSILYRLVWAVLAMFFDPNDPVGGDGADQQDDQQDAQDNQTDRTETE